MDIQTYPADAGAEVYLLTVRGTPKTENPAAARDLHNATAGAPASVAAARSLGDLTHNVFLPTEPSTSQLMFIDTWNSPSGVGQFFGNPQVAEAADALFAERVATLWASAPGFGSYTLPAPAGRSVAGVGYLRAAVTSYEAAQAAFRTHAAAGINKARLAGQLAHLVWVAAPTPGAEQVVEVLGLDFWLDAQKMLDYYDAGDFTHIAPVFAGRPDSDTWQPAGPAWIEW